MEREMFDTPSVTVDEPRPVRSRSSLECLAIVARSHGLNLDVSEMVKNNRLSDRPASTKDVLRCARRAGLWAKVVKISGGDLGPVRKKMPAIVTLKSGASMVLVRIDRLREEEAQWNRVTLRDPTADDGALLTIDGSRFEEAYTDEVILVGRNYDVLDEEQPFTWGLVRALLFRERRIVRDLTISAAILSIFALAPIMFWRLLTDKVLQDPQSPNSMNTFVVLCVMMLVIILCETILAYLRNKFIFEVTTRVDIRMQEYAYDKLLRLPIDYFERTQAGEIGHDFHETRKIRLFLEKHLFGTILDSMILFVFLPVMFLFSPTLTAIVVGFCGLIVLWLIFMLPANRVVTGAVVRAESQKGAFLYQNLLGIRTVKTLALETRQRREWDFHSRKIVNLRLKQGFIMALTEAGVRPLERLAVAGGLATGVFIAISTNDPVYVGALFAFAILSQRVAQPLMNMAQLLYQFDEARAAVGHVGGLVNRPKEEAANDRGIRTPLRGHISFVALRFKYQGATSYALDGVTFEVPVGQTLGVVGRSGSGKTTITRLLQRLHPDYEGSIEIDGVDVRDYDIGHLRRNLGVVLQENFLFSGTIRENIAAGKPHATFEEIVRATQMAGAEEFIDRLPRGYETHIYEGSPNLSGGQKQRLAIARALIVDPRILILDEATSALDPDSEAIVNENIRRIAQGRTVIVISHRLSSLVNSDAILVLERGKFVDLGKHYELLERCEIYSGLWSQQNRHIAAASRPAAARGPSRVS